MDRKPELYHWGVKGMKWGVRRYQNKDGSLTPAGKKRYDRDLRELSDDKKKTYEEDPDKWVKDDLRSGRKLAEESSSLSNKLKNLNDSSMRQKPKTRADLSSMTDKEMRDRINRELLERQYNDMFTPQNVSKGRTIVSKTLEVGAGLLSATATALGIALAIKELKG